MFICCEASSVHLPPQCTNVLTPDSLRFIIAVESRHRLRSAMNDAQQPIVRVRAVLVISCFSVCALLWCDETIRGAFLLHLYQFTSLYCEGQNFGVFIARGLMDMR